MIINANVWVWIHFGFFFHDSFPGGHEPTTTHTLYSSTTAEGRGLGVLLVLIRGPIRCIHRCFLSLPSRSGVPRRGRAVRGLRVPHRRPLPVARQRALLARDVRQVRRVPERAVGHLLLPGPAAVLQARLWEVRSRSARTHTQTRWASGQGRHHAPRAVKLINHASTVACQPVWRHEHFVKTNHF